MDSDSLIFDIKDDVKTSKDNYDIKMNLIKDSLSDIKQRKQRHSDLHSKYRKMNTIVKGFVNTLNAVSVCSMVLTFTPISDMIMLSALASTSVSSVLSAMTSAMDLEEKISSHNTSYLQYNDIYRETQALVLRNGLSSSDLDVVIDQLNGKMSLIEDRSLPV
jgi:hypothetical protein